MSAESAKLEQIENSVNVVSGLSKMQRHWLIRYLLHGNATRAADEAGYSTPNKSGPRLRKNPKIQNAIDEYFYAEEMGARETVARLSRQARGDMSDFISVPRRKNGEYIVELEPELNLRKAHSRNKLDLIKKFSQTTHTTVNKDGGEHTTTRTNIELYDAQSALEKIGRYHGIFTDKTEVNQVLTVNMDWGDNDNDND